jgi:YVTN family beta-propeller protein
MTDTLFDNQKKVFQDNLASFGYLKSIEIPILLTILLLLLPIFLSAQWLETTISVGSNPWALVYNPTHNKVYCAHLYSDTVTVIDGAADTVIATIPAGSYPWALAYNSTNNKVYCANATLGGGLPGTVTVIDGAADTVITTITVGSWPYALVYNPTNNEVYCANYASDNVTVIDGSDNLVITTVPVTSCPDALAYNSNSPYHKVYCANNVIGGGTVTVIVWDGPAAHIPVGHWPVALVYNPTDNKVYCANRGSDNVTVIDGETNAVVTTIAVGSDPYALVYNSTNNKIYCANVLSDNVTVIDGTTNDVITTITVGSEPCAFAWDPVQNRTYVANYGSASVSVIRDEVVGIEEESKYQNLKTENQKLKVYPNPFSEKTVIRCSMLDTNVRSTLNVQHSTISLKVYDASGRLVKNFSFPTAYSLLSTVISWNGTDSSNRKLPCGVYFARLELPERSITKKIIKLK